MALRMTSQSLVTPPTHRTALRHRQSQVERARGHKSSPPNLTVLHKTWRCAQHHRSHKGFRTSRRSFGTLFLIALTVAQRRLLKTMPTLRLRRGAVTAGAQAFLPMIAGMCGHNPVSDCDKVKLHQQLLIVTVQGGRKIIHHRVIRVPRSDQLTVVVTSSNTLSSKLGVIDRPSKRGHYGCVEAEALDSLRSTLALKSNESPTITSRSLSFMAMWIFFYGCIERALGGKTSAFWCT